MAMSKKERQKMDRFITNLMKGMTLQQKIGQLNNPNSSGADTTGASAAVDVEQLVRRGEVGTTAGDNPERRRKLQEIAIKEGAKIPIAFALDVNHGYRTTFPISLGLSCSWDMKLIEKTARAAAVEATSEGVSVTWTPMVDISHDARWGRVAESAGEDPYLGARVATAMVKGLQGNLRGPDTMIATAKHFAGYGFSQAGRDYNTVDISPYKMHNIVFPPFKAAVEAGVGGIMVAFNDVSGVAATAHKEMLDDLLRRKWGYKGFLATDYTAILEMTNHGTAKDLKEAAYQAAKAGLTNDLVSEAYVLHLADLVKEGRIKEKEVDRLCRYQLEMKYKLGLFDDPFRHMDKARGEKVILSKEHRALAREAAAKSCVLLKNDNAVLPLKKGTKIALVGPLAAGEDARNNMQGTWAVSANPKDSVTVEEGLRNVAGKGAQIIYAKGANIEDDPNIAARIDVHNNGIPTASIDSRSPEDMIAEAVKAAENSDVIVACVGEAKEHSGESSTRSEIGLPGNQRKLLEALKKTGKPLVLVTMSGRPLALEWEDKNADAILHSWFAGTEAGNGIADLLYGDRNPSGKLTMSFPRNAGMCPVSYLDPSTGRPHEKAGIDVLGDSEKNNKGVNVFRKFTTACRLEGAHTPLYPFGFGLSYTNFAYSPMHIDKTHLHGSKDILRATVKVKNTGNHAGEETVQLYITDPVATLVRPTKELKGFQKVTLQPGEEKDVTFEITPEELKFYKAKSIADYQHVWEEGEFIIRIGSSSGDLQSASVQWDKAPRLRAGQKPGRG